MVDVGRDCGERAGSRAAGAGMMTVGAAIVFGARAGSRIGAGEAAVVDIDRTCGVTAAGERVAPDNRSGSEWRTGAGSGDAAFGVSARITLGCDGTTGRGEGSGVLMIVRSVDRFE